MSFVKRPMKQKWLVKKTKTAKQIQPNKQGPMNNKIFIQPIEENFDYFLGYATKHNYNLEIAAFAFADTLDAHWRSLLKQYKAKLKNFSGIISVHGTFNDLMLNSRDKKIRKIAKERLRHGLEIAKALNAKYIVFHGNFNSLVGHESYKRNWVKKHVEFWKAATKKYKITIVLENLWEPYPELFKEILEKVNSPRLKVCFDTGHANVFSKVPSAKWFSVLKNDIVYVHVNDNKGKIDSELIPGKGNIKWRSISNVIKRNKMKPNIIFEVGDLDNTIKAIDYFKKNRLYPF